MAVEAKAGVTTSGYLYFWFLTLDLSKISNGGVIPQLNRKDLASLELPVPNISAQDRIVEELGQAEAHCGQIFTEFIQRKVEGSHLRDAILRRAFAGEL